MKKIVIGLVVLAGLMAILLHGHIQPMPMQIKAMPAGEASVAAIHSAPGFMATVRSLPTMADNPAAPTPEPQGENRLLIRNVNISLQVTQINPTMDKIVQLASQSGGYVVNSRITQNNSPDTFDTAQISIRVPAEKLQPTLMQLKSLAKRVTDEEVSGEDITKQYVDLESQLKNLSTSKIQLEKIMGSAQKTQDVLSVYQQLSNIQGQIDLIEGQIKYYKESIAFSLITIQLHQVAVIEDSDRSPFARTAKQAYHDLLNQLQAMTHGLITFFIYLLPLLLLWLALFFLVIWIVKKIYRLF